MHIKNDEKPVIVLKLYRQVKTVEALTVNNSWDCPDYDFYIWIFDNYFNKDTQMIVFQNNSAKIKYKVDFCNIDSKTYYDKLLSNSK